MACGVVFQPTRHRSVFMYTAFRNSVYRAMSHLVSKLRMRPSRYGGSRYNGNLPHFALDSSPGDHSARNCPIHGGSGMVWHVHRQPSPHRVRPASINASDGKSKASHPSDSRRVGHRDGTHSGHLRRRRNHKVRREAGLPCFGVFIRLPALPVHEVGQIGAALRRAEK